MQLKSPACSKMHWRPLQPLLPKGVTLPTEVDVSRLADVLRRGPVLCVSGAGISTESGLSDYRSPGVAERRRRPPIQHEEFVKSASIRRRYWARSYIGFPLLSQTVPNITHHALTALHNKGDLFCTHITQNVDGLLRTAGIDQFGRGKQYLELHGTVSRVQCLRCEDALSRAEFQGLLESHNSNWTRGLGNFEYRPDGDAELDDRHVAEFNVPACRKCSRGDYMPSLVFNGGSVPKADVARALQMVDECRALFVIGSTTTTYSSYSLVKRAKERGCAIAIANFGETRSDNLADVKVTGLVSSVMAGLCDVFDITLSSVDEPAVDQHRFATHHARQQSM